MQSGACKLYVIHFCSYLFYPRFKPNLYNTKLC